MEKAHLLYCHIAYASVSSWSMWCLQGQEFKVLYSCNIDVCRKIVALAYLEANLHGCFSNGQVSTPDIVQEHMLRPNKCFGFVLEANGVNIQCSVQEADCLP